MLDLSNLAPGFSEPGLESQQVFRQCLHALAHPGTIITLPLEVAVPAPMMPATGAIALALLDQDTRVWLSPGLSTAPVIDYLRFHTGCHVTSDSSAADFALVQSTNELVSLARFNQGTDEFPEHSTTVVLQIAELGTDPIGNSPAWELTGPGIKHQCSLRVDPGSLPTIGSDGNSAAADFTRRFAPDWLQNHQRFPGGVDVFFVSGHQLCALPRSTRLHLLKGV